MLDIVYKTITKKVKDEEGKITIIEEVVPLDFDLEIILREDNLVYVRVEYGEEGEESFLNAHEDRFVVKEEEDSTYTGTYDDLDMFLLDTHGVTLREAKLSQCKDREGIIPPSEPKNILHNRYYKSTDLPDTYIVETIAKVPELKPLDDSSRYVPEEK